MSIGIGESGEFFKAALEKLQLYDVEIQAMWRLLSYGAEPDLEHRLAYNHVVAARGELTARVAQHLAKLGKIQAIQKQADYEYKHSVYGTRKAAIEQIASKHS
jgi:hypothetical protein